MEPNCRTAMHNERLNAMKTLLRKSRDRRRKRGCWRETHNEATYGRKMSADQSITDNSVFRNLAKRHSWKAGRPTNGKGAKLGTLSQRNSKRNLSPSVVRAGVSRFNRRFTFHSTTSDLSSDTTEKQAVDKKGVRLFQHAVKMVILCRQFCKLAHTQLTHEESILFFLDIPTAALDVGDSGATSQTREASGFDINCYRSIKEQNTLLALKSCLQTPPDTRSKQTVSAILHLLQSYSRFAGYPIPAQHRICQLAWYSRFGTTSVVCRQGHQAECFYFILSGVAIARCMDNTNKGNKRKQKAIILRRGDAIGEKELLEHGPREMTVITKEPVEVLGLDKQEYIEVFQSTRGKDLDYLDFLRSVPDLAAFPLHLLADNQAACNLTYYRRGTVIVKDSKKCDSVYVVKQGSCQVFKPIESTGDILETRASLPGYSTPDEKTNHLILPAIQPYREGKVAKDEPSHTNLRRRKSLSTGQLDVLPRINPAEQINLVQQQPSYVQNNDYGGDYKNGGPDSDSEANYNPRSSGASDNRRQPGHRRRSLSQSQASAYAKLDTIIEKDVFGLQGLIYDDTPSLSLVSNGAECAVISKQFLVDNMDAYILSQLRKNLAPYPTMSVLQHSLENRVQWNSYKEHVLRQKMDALSKLNADKLK